MWKGFCDVVGRTAQGSRIEIEVASLEYGDQIESDWCQFLGISYENKENAIFVYTSEDDQRIDNPLSIVVDEDGVVIRSITVKDAAEELYILQFRRPLQLTHDEMKKPQLRD